MRIERGRERRPVRAEEEGPAAALLEEEVEVFLAEAALSLGAALAFLVEGSRLGKRRRLVWRWGKTWPEGGEGRKGHECGWREGGSERSKPIGVFATRPSL